MSTRQEKKATMRKTAARHSEWRQHDVLRNLNFWQLQVGGWSAYLLFPLSVWLTGGLTSPQLLWLGLARAPSGLLLTSALRPLCHRVLKSKLHYAVLLAVLLVTAVVLGFLELQATRWLGSIIGIPEVSFEKGSLYSGLLLLRSVILFSWLLLYFGIKALQQSVEVEQEFQAAEARLLRSQMNPHFLFNALNTIMAVRRDAEKVAAITQSLADYLHFSLRQEESEAARIVTHVLRDELAALEDYMQVEKMRFGSDLLYRIDADEDAGKTLVPSALVQPLLENAIKYGQETSPRPLNISITAQIVQEKLLVEVRNSGRWVERTTTQVRSIGLTNLTRRLELIYGAAASLHTSHTAVCVIVSVLLPKHPPK